MVQGRHTAVAGGKLICGREQSNSNEQALSIHYLSHSIPLAEYFIACLNRYSLCPIHFIMATFESTKFIPFVFPPSNTRFCNNGSLLPAITSRSSHLVSNQRIRGPAASSSHSESQVEVDRYAGARAEGTWKRVPKVHHSDLSIQVESAPSLRAMMNQTTISHLSRSSLKPLCVRRSWLSPQKLDPPFNLQNS